MNEHLPLSPQEVDLESIRFDKFSNSIEDIRIHQ